MKIFTRTRLVLEEDAHNDVFSDQDKPVMMLVENRTTDRAETDRFLSVKGYCYEEKIGRQP